RKAFKEKNQDFLISQGESYYESDMRSKYPKAQYLALLYRVGPYSKDSTWQLPAYQIDINTIHDLQWVEFVDKGPVLLVEAKIITNDFKTIPCSIMLLWRLNEPKVMGTYP
ncbi:MAG: hypothetical protein LBV52_03820, partial [Spirochaetaceae bacterium]|nr:hypothetical protein [Spirochaetaceae bacterium]